jgi:hypothetical protein
LSLSPYNHQTSRKTDGLALALFWVGVAVKTIRNFALTYLALLVLTLFVFLFVPRAFSAPIPSSRGNGSCHALIEELNQMRKAQNQIITSLAQNHDMFADQLSDLSFELSLYRKTVPQKALDSMEKSAQAYHARALKAQQSAEKLDDLTGDLIGRIQHCLK